MAKGTSNDFSPTKPVFHLQEANGQLQTIAIQELKAIFFVKDFSGDSTRNDSYQDSVVAGGRKIRVEFIDGEVIVGFCIGYSKDRPGFFLTPADRGSNNERIFAVSSACKKVEFI